MRTLCVFHIGGVGGPQRSLPQVVEWLASRGEVEFIVPERGATESQYRAYGPVSMRPYSALTYVRGGREGVRLLRRTGREVRMFRRELRERRPDLVIAVTTVLPSLLAAARLERVPSIVYAAELYDQGWKDAPLLRLWGTLLAHGTASLSHGIVCCSDRVARQFPGRPRRPLAVAYPPVGDEYAGGDREAGRRRLGIPGDAPCLVVAGSISRGRGQDVAMRAFALVRERVPDARLALVGEPHPRPVDLAFAEELRAEATQLGLDDAVTFAEATDAMADVYAAADVVVNPARFSEPFGRVAPEALIAGRPVVATRVGAIPDVIRADVDGLLVESDDAPAVAEAVTRLLDDPGLAARLVESGRTAVERRFGYEQDIAAWRSVVDRVVA